MQSKGEGGVSRSRRRDLTRITGDLRFRLRRSWKWVRAPQHQEGMLGYSRSRVERGRERSEQFATEQPMTACWKVLRRRRGMRKKALSYPVVPKRRSASSRQKIQTFTG